MFKSILCLHKCANRAKKHLNGADFILNKTDFKKLKIIASNFQTVLQVILAEILKFTIVIGKVPNALLPPKYQKSAFKSMCVPMCE